MPGLLPHDWDAEDALIGDMLASAEALRDIPEIVVVSDFSQPIAAHAFEALTEAYATGTQLDERGLAAELRTRGFDNRGWVIGCRSKESVAWDRQAVEVVQLRIRRQLISLAHQAQDAAQDLTADPYGTLDRLQAELGQIHIPDGTPPADLHSLDEFIDRPENEQPPWLIPGLLRRGWRVVIVAGEGKGKSVVMRQFAVLAAQGVHPFSLERCTEPLRTLLVDLENPPEALVETCVPVREQAKRAFAYEPGRAWLWHRPQGINLRTRNHQAEFAAVLANVRPDVVCLGPLYKTYEKSGRETDEQVASEVQRVFDDLRTRFGFALLLEHHAPQDSGGFRQIRPFGSSLWLRWPELGIAMQKDQNDPSLIELGRWRGDRVRNLWPDRLSGKKQHPSQVWPWVGVWNRDRRIEP